VIGGGGGEELTDFEGRALAASASSLKITGGPAARVTVRWRFGNVASAAVNGVPAVVHVSADGPSIDFSYSGETTVAWQ
jgi:hypothetical protein